jgi:excisionase family DNA binding protein
MTDNLSIVGGRAMTIREVARILRVSYGTVYAHRAEMGFFQIGAAWRVFPQKLQEFLDGYNQPRPARTDKETVCQSENVETCITLTSANQTAVELDALLGPTTARRRRSITTS